MRCAKGSEESGKIHCLNISKDTSPQGEGVPLMFANDIIRTGCQYEQIPDIRLGPDHDN